MRVKANIFSPNTANTISRSHHAKVNFSTFAKYNSMDKTKAQTTKNYIFPNHTNNKGLFQHQKSTLTTTTYEPLVADAKLYYTPQSCGAASFIAAYSAGIRLQAEEVDLRTHKTASGEDFYSINPKGNVPAIILDCGTLLNENVAALQYIADLRPGSIAPLNDTLDRLVLQNTLSYLASEVHPTIGGLFYPGHSHDVKQYLRENANKKLLYVDHHLIDDRLFLHGHSFTIADSYLYIILSWTKALGIDLNAYHNILFYFDRIAALPNVKAARERMATKPTTTF